jgi:hypothetical protein
MPLARCSARRMPVSRRWRRGHFEPQRDMCPSADELAAGHSRPHLCVRVRTQNCGTRAILLEPHDLLVRLCASVPAPRLHLVRYFGVLSSHHAVRAETAAPEPGLVTPAAAPGDQQSLPLGTPDADPPRSGRGRWGWLIGHVFLADVEHCNHWSGPCAGSRPPPPPRSSLGCSPSMASGRVLRSPLGRPHPRGTAQLCVRARPTLSSSTHPGAPDARPLTAGIQAQCEHNPVSPPLPRAPTPDPLRRPSGERRAPDFRRSVLSGLAKALTSPPLTFQLRLDLALRPSLRDLPASGLPGIYSWQRSTACDARECSALGRHAPSGATAMSHRFSRQCNSVHERGGHWPPARIAVCLP